MTESFSGNLETDLPILQNLDETTLIEQCSQNEYLKSLFRTYIFPVRLTDRFGKDILPLLRKIKYPLDSYFEFYVGLTNLNDLQFLRKLRYQLLTSENPENLKLLETIEKSGLKVRYHYKGIILNNEFRIWETRDKLNRNGKVALTLPKILLCLIEYHLGKPFEFPRDFTRYQELLTLGHSELLKFYQPLEQIIVKNYSTDILRNLTTTYFEDVRSKEEICQNLITLFRSCKILQIPKI